MNRTKVERLESIMLRKLKNAKGSERYISSESDESGKVWLINLKRTRNIYAGDTSCTLYASTRTHMHKREAKIRNRHTVMNKQSTSERRNERRWRKERKKERKKQMTAKRRREGKKEPVVGG
jgi:hypothetical protein